VLCFDSPTWYHFDIVVAHNGDEPLKEGIWSKLLINCRTVCKLINCRTVCQLINCRTLCQLINCRTVCQLINCRTVCQLIKCRTVCQLINCRTVCQSVMHHTWTSLGLIQDIRGEELQSASPRKQQHQEKVTDYEGCPEREVGEAHNLTTFICRLSWNLGDWTSGNPQGLYRPAVEPLFTCMSPIWPSFKAVEWWKEGIIRGPTQYQATLSTWEEEQISFSRRFLSLRIQGPVTRIHK